MFVGDNSREPENKQNVSGFNHQLWTTAIWRRGKV